MQNLHSNLQFCFNMGSKIFIFAFDHLIKITWNLIRKEYSLQVLWDK